MLLLEVVRNGFVESRHDGSFVLLDGRGAVAVAAGAIDEPVLPRSSLKPLQTITLLECGFSGRDEALALAAASHDGEDVHIAGARAILDSAGLNETALQCPPDLPSGTAALVAWIGAGGQAAPICHNCSAKHAAMVATCADAGWPIDSYLSPDHPLQRAIRAGIEARCGEPVTGVAVDGCGAPAFAVTLRGLARAFAGLAWATEGPAGLVADAMRAWPRLIGGTGRAVSELTAAVPGLLCKDGAEGVWAAALPDGRAFAAKVSDGAPRALPPVLAAALRYWEMSDGDAANPVVRRWSAVAVLGGGAPVGAITWSAELRALLGL